MVEHCEVDVAKQSAIASLPPDSSVGRARQQAARGGRNARGIASNSYARTASRRNRSAEERTSFMRPWPGSTLLSTSTIPARAS